MFVLRETSVRLMIAEQCDITSSNFRICSSVDGGAESIGAGTGASACVGAGTGGGGATTTIGGGCVGVGVLTLMESCENDGLTGDEPGLAGSEG